jgi:hypothetical protein
MHDVLQLKAKSKREKEEKKKRNASAAISRVCYPFTAGSCALVAEPQLDNPQHERFFRETICFLRDP